MATPILMPALSPTMTEGTITKWLKSEGDLVHSGDLLAEIETDKATMELEAVDEGVLVKIIQPDGAEGVQVNEPIGVILSEGEDPSDATLLTDTPSQPVSKGEKTAGSKKDLRQEPISAPHPETSPRASTELKDSGERIFASPLARRLISEYQADITTIVGTGPSGRIVKRDLERSLGSSSPQGETNSEDIGAVPSLPVLMGSEPRATAGSQVPSVPLALPEQVFTEVPHSNMRKVIAQRLQESKQQIPHFYLTNEVEIDKLLQMQEDLNGRAPEGEGAFKITVNDFVIRAVALSLKKVPMVNVSWTDTAMHLFKNIDVAVAVAIDGGLITPIVRNADQKGLAQISLEMKELADRAKNGKLVAEEYQGGSFSISNLGMFGVREFSAIINPPQSCIMAVGAGEPRPVVKNGALSIATMMCCTLSVDHRAVDGALAAEFLQVFKEMIEDPLTMML